MTKLITPVGDLQRTAAKSMTRLADKVQDDHPGMLTHRHLRDAARVLMRGQTEGAKRHLDAATHELQPQTLYRHGHLTDEHHAAAKQNMGEVNRHRLLVQDIEDVRMRNQDNIAARRDEAAQNKANISRLRSEAAGTSIPSAPEPSSSVNAPSKIPVGRIDINVAKGPAEPSPTTSQNHSNSYDMALAFLNEKRGANGKWMGSAEQVSQARQHWSKPAWGKNTYASKPGNSYTKDWPGKNGAGVYDRENGMIGTVSKEGGPGWQGKHMDGTTFGRHPTKQGAVDELLHYHNGMATRQRADPAKIASLENQNNPEIMKVTGGENPDQFDRDLHDTMAADISSDAQIRRAIDKHDALKAAGFRHSWDIGLSAETGRLAVTPAPRGKPGGPGLYDVKGLGHTPYLQQVVKALIEKRGMSPDKAYAIARASIRKWMAKSKHPEVKAAATAAEAGELGKQALAHAHSNQVQDFREIWDLANMLVAIELTGTAAGAAKDSRISAGSVGGGRFGSGGQASAGKGGKPHQSSKAQQKAQLMQKIRGLRAQIRALVAQLRYINAHPQGHLPAAAKRGTTKPVSAAAAAARAKKAAAAAANPAAAAKAAAARAARATAPRRPLSPAQRARSAAIRAKIQVLRAQIRAAQRQAAHL